MDWISVNDALPKIGDFVLVAFATPGRDELDVFMCLLDSDGYFEDSEGRSFERVTHWMPLPAPPENANNG